MIYQKKNKDKLNFMVVFVQQLLIHNQMCPLFKINHKLLYNTSLLKSPLSLEDFYYRMLYQTLYRKLDLKISLLQ